MKIERIIHQTCFDKSNIHPDIVENIASLKRLNSGWEYRLYDNADVEKFILDNFGSAIYRVFKKINPKYGAAIADFFRYLVIFKHGGVYLDLKSSISRPLEEVIQPDDTYLLSQWPNKLGEALQGFGLHQDVHMVPGGEFEQWHIVACKDHPFLLSVINRMLFNIENYSTVLYGTGYPGAWRTTGPICYTLAIFPLLHKYSHRIIDSSAVGFDYTIFGRHEHRTILYGRGEGQSRVHYGVLTEPVVI